MKTIRKYQCKTCGYTGDKFAACPKGCGGEIVVVTECYSGLPGLDEVIKKVTTEEKLSFVEEFIYCFCPVEHETEAMFLKSLEKALKWYKEEC
uniref:Uncharacterized protein n=1 Tax=viral metagenome TaxID=1070528 RepID=A0A6M3JFY0_9ZZZZ